jgi:hypothetical protein
MWRSWIVILSFSYIVTTIQAIIDVAKSIPIPSIITEELQHFTEKVTKDLFDTDDSIQMGYSIFSGRSILRTVVPSIQDVRSKQYLALKFLIEKNLDAAHEVILGVNWTNIQEAEYAATHPGMTNWNQRHPLSNEDDLLHSILHRLEGNHIGEEGNYSGWENAKYWATGGPKRHVCFSPYHHPIHQALCQLCPQIAPTLKSYLITKKTRYHHSIPSGDKGRLRSICIEPNCWDPISYINLCHYSEWTDELKAIQIAEILLLLRMELLKIHGMEVAYLLETLDPS